MMTDELTARDPRPDLCEDHELWEAVLRTARETPIEGNALYWALDGLRCMGARLTPIRQGSLRLEAGEEMPEEEFQADCRRYLTPHLELLRRVLREAATEAWMPARVGELLPA